MWDIWNVSVFVHRWGIMDAQKNDHAEKAAKAHSSGLIEKKHFYC